ncbi:MAG: hypothetical protein M1837_001918 [Sclerophora amabilis]|nr:MAG: hypothetical protein M1837_001918 [Sclerophora amabilis]
METSSRQSASVLPEKDGVQIHSSQIDESPPSTPSDHEPRAKTPTAHAVPAYAIETSDPGGPQSKARAKLNSYEYSGSSRRFPRISRPVEMLRDQYDVVVIGSGYGGGVAASRMARANQSVCLLERGKERWPGEYPSDIKEALPEVHVSGSFAPHDKDGKWVETGDRTGLYHLVVGAGQNAFVGNGLGGTSLLNANVFLEADDRTMAMQYWPAELRKKGCLDECKILAPCCSDITQARNLDYDRARSVLEPAPYPENFPDLPKLTLLEKQAKLLNIPAHNFYRVPQTTRFENGPNSTGVEMQASALTGMDSTGLNDGSKSSTLVNYLSDAWNWGAEMFCECEVRHIRKDPSGEGYIVYFAWYGGKRDAFKDNFHDDLMWVRAKKFVFLGAGTLGTTEILLRSKHLGLRMSQNVGEGMSGNGDILAFGYNTDEKVNAMGRPQPSPDHPIGPTITGVIDMRDQTNPLDGFVVEEGAVPGSLAPLLQAMLETTPGKIHAENYGIAQKLRHLLSSSESHLFGPYSPNGSLERTQIYLVMSHDSNQAILTLKDDKPWLEFLGVGRTDHVKYLNSFLAKMTTAVGGTFINSPFFASLGQQEITVHPIGGANMSSDGSTNTGATTHAGELLTGSGTDYHEGLVVVDGSVVPLALGVNPFATITALAERSVEIVSKKKGITIDYETKNGALDLFGRPAHPMSQDDDMKDAQNIIDESTAESSEGIEFSEIMEGHIYLGSDIDDFTIATNAARSSESGARFFLSAHAWDTDRLISRDDHSAMLTGTFTCGALSRDPFLVLRGDIQLFNEDERTPDTKNLTYDFDMIGTNGSRIHFHGYKIVNSSSAFGPWAMWKATSTLYVTLTAMDGSIVGRGILHIKPKAFIHELATFNPSGRGLLSKATSLARFLTYFSVQVAGSFLAPFNTLEWPTVTYTGFDQAKRPPSRTLKITSSDDVQTVMQVWDPLPHIEPSSTSILFIPGAAVDHQIFALPTIKYNAVEYFQDAGHQIFCITHRIGKTMEAQKGWTTYDARLDIVAALTEIRKTTSNKIYVIAHCAGSLALASGLLDGTIPADWIQGITASNVFMNPEFGKVNRVVTRLPISMASVYKTLVGQWFSCSSSKQDSMIQRVLNQALRFYPVGSKAEICNSVACHRSELVFGRLWTHRNLNEATHANVSKFLGGTSMTSLQQLMDMGEHSTVTDNGGTSLVTNDNVARLRGVPILLFSGSENAVYGAVSTTLSYSRLRQQLLADDYEREVFAGKGHLDCWMGADAYTTVYPRVKEHVDRVIRLDREKRGA